MLMNAEALVLKADMVSKGATVFQGSSIDSYKSNTKFELICGYYNALASPQVDLWKPDLTVAEITNVITMSAFILLSQGQRDAWVAMSQAGILDATIPLVRTNLGSIFGAATATGLAAIAIAKKPATNFEALFVTSGASSKYKYILSVEDIYQAIRSI